MDIVLLKNGAVLKISNLQKLLNMCVRVLNLYFVVEKLVLKILLGI